MCSLSQAVSYGTRYVAIGATSRIDRWRDKWRRKPVVDGVGHTEARSYPHKRVVAAMSVGGAAGIILHLIGLSW
jgi:hypothetical protein